MAKEGMRRFKPGDGMDKKKKYNKNKVQPVSELQGHAKENNRKIDEKWYVIITIRYNLIID